MWFAKHLAQAFCTEMTLYLHYCGQFFFFLHRWRWFKVWQVWENYCLLCKGQQPIMIAQSSFFYQQKNGLWNLDDSQSWALWPKNPWHSQKIGAKLSHIISSLHTHKASNSKENNTIERWKKYLKISVQTGCGSRLAKNVKESQRNLPAFFFFFGFWYQDLWNSNDKTSPQILPAF